MSSPFRCQYYCAKLMLCCILLQWKSHLANAYIESPVVGWRQSSGRISVGRRDLQKLPHHFSESSIHQRRRFRTSTTRVTTFNSPGQEDQDGLDGTGAINDLFFDGRTTIALVGGQSLLIVGSIAAAAIIGTPKFGLGPGFVLDWNAISMGVLLTLPLGLLAAALDLIEDKFPALQDVTKATQRSVLALLGGKFKPGVALITSLALGLVAGIGEEMLFRGVLQYELSSRFGQALAIGSSSIIFGALHAVTPLYAFLAALASVYFGLMYNWFSNLAVPITAHAFYDLVALLFAHWTVCRLDTKEQEALSQWKGPGDA